MPQPDDEPQFAASSIVSFAPNKRDCAADQDECNCRMGRWVEVREPMPDELCHYECHHRTFHRTPGVDVGRMHVDIEPEVDHRTKEFVSEIWQILIVSVFTRFPVRSKKKHENAHPLRAVGWVK